MSRIVTFYSYKGGVGRTFALANIAVLLARRGKRVLAMDWDLEAPGLHRYFQSWLAPPPPSKKTGIIHLLNQAAASLESDWRSHVLEVKIDKKLALSLIPSGDQSSGYADHVRAFSWSTFFEQQNGGETLERWRAEWKNDFDFVLIDSRTGITDSGGVCTIFLPDILVLVFTANEQSFECGKQVALGIQKARLELAVQRPPLTIMPLLGRFDGRDEVDEAKHWLDRFAVELKPFYDDWLPSRFEVRQVLELTKVPYITKFSFGEPLPVISHGIRDPDWPGFYLDKIAELLYSDFNEVSRILGPYEDEIIHSRETISAIELVRTLVEEGKYDDARQNVNDLSEELSDLKQTLFEQIDEHYKTQQHIESVVEEASRLVRSGQFQTAREAISILPGKSRQLLLLKENLLNQVIEAERQQAEHNQIEEAIEKARKVTESGRFQMARMIILNLPEKSKEATLLKENFLRQIDEVEKRTISDIMRQLIKNFPILFDEYSAQKKIEFLFGKGLTPEEVVDTFIKNIKSQPKK
jgi:MinD-like ATPase involved in chromosome partitioning or flagellar assembly